MTNLAYSKLGRSVVRLMIALALILALAPSRGALAGFATTVDSQTTKASDLDRVRQVLENKKISQTLSDLGYSQPEIDTRLAQLSDQEIHALAGQLDEAMIPAGDGTAGVVIGVVVVILVVLGILSLMGKSVSVS
ncbi:MAG: PA2779 family protein [Deltaproteobacteria bacterium]|nr:PA2779 family protein [Deltaproteobacteria bacterium]